MLAIENTRQTHGKLLSKPNVNSWMNSLATLNSLSLFSGQGQCAEKNWRKLRGFDYRAKVIEGVQFSDGIDVIPEIRIAA